jgi:hypothetical protein
MKAKKNKSINMRIDEPTWNAFEMACDTINENKSRIIRELCIAATKYITDNQLEQWYPPKLVVAPPEIQTKPGFLTYLDGPSRVSVRIKSDDEMAHDKSIAKAAEPRGPQAAQPPRATTPLEYPRIKKKRT